MSKIEKRLESWRNGRQPIPINDLYSVLDHFFPEMYRTGKGSHLVVWHPKLAEHPSFAPAGEFCIPVHHGQKIKRRYIDRLLIAIEIIKEE